jgi:hypothetical protein
MSFGSRATRRNLKRWSSCSEQTPEAASFLRVTAGLSPHAHGISTFHLEIFFARAGVDSAPVRCGAESELDESRSILAIDDKFESDIDSLIEVGKEKGYLTYGDVNDILPDEIGSADDLDDLITTIGTQGIDLLDSPKFRRRQGL